MAKEQEANPAQPALKYRRVHVADLNRGRRGKHHDLVQGILRESDTPRIAGGLMSWAASKAVGLSG